MKVLGLALLMAVASAGPAVGGVGSEWVSPDMAAGPVRSVLIRTGVPYVRTVTAAHARNRTTPRASAERGLRHRIEPATAARITLVRSVTPLFASRSAGHTALAVPPGHQQLFEYSDGYATRLDLHRKASYAMLPLFALQIVTGEVLLRDRESPPGWAKAVHRPFAWALGGLFAVNLVTGGLNALEVRRDPNAGMRPTLHTALMLLADAGMVWTGVKASGAGKPGPTGRIRTTHRKIALISMGMATTGFLMMISPFRD